MTPVELIVVAIGLLAGWSIISSVFGRIASRRFSKMGHRPFSDGELRESWPKLLQVRRSAAPEEIRAACRERQEALRKRYPAVMTDVENAEYERAKAVLGRAAALATSHSLLP